MNLPFLLIYKYEGTPDYLRFASSKWERLRRLLFIAAVVSGSTCFAQITIRVPADQPTIQAGINAAQSGDTVLVSPGIYNENIDFKGKRITLTSGAKTYADAATTIINGVTDGAVVNLTTNESQGTVLNGFTIQGGHATQSSQAFAAGVAIYGSAPLIANNRIQQNIGCGILVGAAANPVIQGNDIFLNRAPYASEPTLAPNCTLSGQGGAGTGVSIVSASSVKLLDNIIENNQPVFASNSGGIYLLFTPYAFLMNNIVRGNAGGAGLTTGVGGQIGTLILIQNLFEAHQGLVTSGSFSAPYPTLIEVNNTIYSSQELVLNYGTCLDSISKCNIFRKRGECCMARTYL